RRRCEAPARSDRIDRARHRAVVSSLVEEPRDALDPRVVALAHKRAELLVVTQARPDFVPERRRLLELGLDRPHARTLSPLRAGPDRCKLCLERRDAQVFGIGERRAQELLASREVVVDERARDARLLRNAPDPQIARTSRDDDATGGAQDLVDAGGG